MRILNQETLVSHGNCEGRKAVVELLEIGLTATDPYYKARDLITVEGNKLYVGGADFEPIGSPRTGIDVYDLDADIDRIFVFGAGKGIWRAIQAFEETLGDRLTGGHVILKHGDEGESRRIGISRGGHPIPDEDCVKGCRALVNSIREAHLTPRDLVITVVGNGVSSLLTLPPEGLTLQDVQTVTQVIQIERGFPTPKLNLVRNQVDQLKGGRITRLLQPARMVHVVTVDVNEGNDQFNCVGYRARTDFNEWLHTLPDMTTPEIAAEFLTENELWDGMTPAVVDYLKNHAKNNPSLKTPEFERMDCRIFGLSPRNRSCVPAMERKAKQLGYSFHWMSKQYFAEVSEISKLMCNIGKLCDEDGSPFRPPCVLLFLGEGLVTVGGHSGVGGRNQELCLNAAVSIAGKKRIVVGAVDTDGTDGPGGDFHPEATRTGVLVLDGGVVDGYTMEEAARRGVDWKALMREHAASNALWSVDSGVVATQNISTNDIVVVLVMDHDG